MTSTRTFFRKWKNSASRAACKPASFHRHLPSPYFADSIPSHCFVTPQLSLTEAKAMESSTLTNAF